MVICRNKEGKYLAVNETKDRGWWLPAGWVDPGESFIEAAHRETKEEAGIDIILKGILRIEHSENSGQSARMRVIFYAEPENEKQAPKSIADKESLEAKWMSVDEFLKLKNIRGYELPEWGKYIDSGGPIYPMSLLTRESAAIPKNPKKEFENIIRF